MGTLRRLGLVGHVDVALTETAAWEAIEEFATPTTSVMGSVWSSHEGTSLSLVDAATGEWQKLPDMQDAVMAAVSDAGVVVVSMDYAIDEPRLRVGFVDPDLGTQQRVYSTVTDPELVVDDVFVQDGFAVISRSIHGPVPMPGRALIVDLERGVGFEVDDAAWISPVHVPVLEVDVRTFHGVPMAASFEFDNVMLDGIEPLQGDTFEELVANYGEPVSSSEFEWGGGATGYEIDFGEFEVTIYYGPSHVATEAPGVCTAAGLCIGDSFTRLEQIYGLTTQQLVEQDGGWTRSSWLLFNLDNSWGYCHVGFDFGHEEAEDSPSSLQRISHYCLPD